MTQDPGTNSSFHVDSNEVVSVTVTGHQCANLTVAGFNGVTTNQNPPGSGVYSFPVLGTAADTAQFPFEFVCRCTFLPPPPNISATAPYYSVTLSGSNGGNFQGPKVHISIPEVTFSLDFSIN
jgi:hypothetical protein